MFSRLRKRIIEYKELKYLAYHDSLTGLLNRNWLYKHINDINREYVYFIDINNLHEINKRGHTFGDKHLIICIENIKMQIQKNDILLRYAGDEFILLSNNDKLIKNNCFFTVGKTKVVSCLRLAINKADQKMIAEKNKLKIKR